MFVLFANAVIIQELLIAVTAANPTRKTGYEDTGHLPNMSYVRRFADRNLLSMRTSSEISKGRQILTKQDIALWQKDTSDFLFGNEELAAAMQDPRRVFNQDETAVELGSSEQKVLAPINTKIVYSISSGSREHVTASYLVNASGEMVPPRLVFKGVRNVAEEKLKNLDKSGESGAWKFSVSPKGYITRDLFAEVLYDLDKFLTEKKIPRPVVLFIDGASPHISLEAARLCRVLKIQPWLFKPNATHLLQPLDLTFFKTLKIELKKIVWDWQTNPLNAGQSLSKYSIVPLLHSATEKCLKTPNLISNGFKRTGIIPWDTEAPNYDKLLPGTIFEGSQLNSTDDMESPPESSVLSVPESTINTESVLSPPESTLNTESVLSLPESNLNTESARQPI